MQKSTMISLTAALAACVLSGCFGGMDSSTTTVVSSSPTPFVATTPTPKVTTYSSRPTPSTRTTSPLPSPTREAFAYAVPRKTEPTREVAPPELQLLRQCGSKAVCITRIVKQRAMLGPHLYIEGILDIEVNLIEMVMESLVSGARRSTTSCC